MALIVAFSAGHSSSNVYSSTLTWTLGSQVAVRVGLQNHRGGGWSEEGSFDLTCGSDESVQAIQFLEDDVHTGKWAGVASTDLVSTIDTSKFEVGVGIPTGIDKANQLAAATFVKFLTSPENTVRLSQATGDMPMGKSADTSALLSRVLRCCGVTDVSELRIERRPGVVEVTFDRPERHNAFTHAMYGALHELCDSLAGDSAVKVLVLRGAGGRAFAAGNEISDFLTQDAVAYEDWIRALLLKLFALPQVTVAAVDGVCVGGGLAVATHCDLRVATPHSRFGYPIAKTLGNALAAPIVYRCAAVFGEPLTREMLLAARLVEAPRAYAVGALTAVAPSLDDELPALVESILSLSSVTLRATKSQLLARAGALEAAPAGDDALLHEVYTGPHFAEGVRAFLAKERPAFG